MRLVISLGNSNLKVAYGEPGNWRFAGSLPADKSYLLATEPPPGEEAWVASVNPFQLEALSQVLDRPVRLVQWDDRLGLKSKYADPKTMGADRLANAVALSKGSLPAVAVDGGTAITLTVVTGEGIEGGAILPGYSLMALALDKGTAQLPEVSIGTAPNLLGASSEDAIRGGIHAAAVGGVQMLLSDYEARFGPLRVVFTGGSSEMLQAALGKGEIQKELTLDGIYEAAERLS